MKTFGAALFIAVGMQIMKMILNPVPVPTIEIVVKSIVLIIGWGLIYFVIYCIVYFIKKIKNRLN